MRQVLIAFLSLLFCSPLLGKPPDSIAPGISLAAAKATLLQHGYEVDALKYGLAMAAPKDGKLEFCPIDGNITLVIHYKLSTQRVVSLGVVFIPDKPSSKLQRVSREALEIAFEDDGIYFLKLQRTEKQAIEPRKGPQ